MASRHGLEIRAASAADAPGLAELLRVGDIALGPRTVAERLEALRQQPGAVLLADEWGPPSGVIVLHWASTLQAAAPVAEITLLLVAPDDRRRGVGRLLLKAASQAARLAGCDALRLTTPPDAASLCDFAGSTGFVSAGAVLLRPLRKRSAGA